SVIENRHGVVADDHEFLLLIWMQPGDEDVSLLAPGKGQMRGGHVGDGWMEVVPADGLDTVRLASRELKNHRDVVRSEAPENVLFASDQTEVQPVRVHVLQAAH